MSCSKPLPPFVHDSLYYLNRDRLERFSIVCRQLKNFIDRYLHTKPYRVFDKLWIFGGLFDLRNNEVQWHPNRDDYSAQQFLAGEAPQPSVEDYSFDEMRRFLDQTVRIEQTWIDVTGCLDGGTAYNPVHIEEMESIAHLWGDRKINVWKMGRRIVADDIQLILSSPKILQCRYLIMQNAHFSFKDYKVLYNAKIIEIGYYDDATDCNYCLQFLEQPEIKPLVVLRELHRDSINTVVDHLFKTFPSAVLPNTFKIVFAENRKPLTEFRKTNETSGEKLELKKGLPIEYQNENSNERITYLNGYFNYTLERSSI